MTTSKRERRILVLGIGNVLMGDEGVGLEVLYRVAARGLPPGVEFLDGGTGSLVLLEPMQNADTVILIDATIDGNEPGTVRKLRPRFSSDYPRTLTAHDIGLKDLLDAMYLLERSPEVILFAISIGSLSEIEMGLSPELSGKVNEIATAVLEEAWRCAGEEKAVGLAPSA